MENLTVHYTTSEPPGEFPIIGDTPIPGTRQLPNIAWTKDEAHARRLVLAWNNFTPMHNALQSAEECIANFIGMYGDSGAGLILREARAILAKVKKEQEATARAVSSSLSHRAAKEGASGLRRFRRLQRERLFLGPSEPR